MMELNYSCSVATTILAGVHQRIPPIFIAIRSCRFLLVVVVVGSSRRQGSWSGTRGSRNGGRAVSGRGGRHRGLKDAIPLPEDEVARDEEGASRSLLIDRDAYEDDAVGGSSPPRDESAVEHDGFSLRANVAIESDDGLRRERLMRYGARPPLALDRQRWLPGGIACRIKQLRDGRAKQRAMSPLEFMARLAALVPPPRQTIFRYSGVFGPRFSWRRDVVPRPSKRAKPCDEPTGSEGQPQATGGNP